MNQAQTKLFYFILLMGFIPGFLWGAGDKNVQWGYKLTLEPQTSWKQLQALRKKLKLKGAEILFPAENQWKIPVGYLNISSHLEEQEIKKLSPLILEVVSAEKTRKLLFHLKKEMGKKDVNRFQQILRRYKIQVLAHPAMNIPPYYSVKTALTPQQIKELDELQNYIESIEETT